MGDSGKIIFDDVWGRGQFEMSGPFNVRLLNLLESLRIFLFAYQIMWISCSIDKERIFQMTVTPKSLITIPEEFNRLKKKGE